VFVACGVVLVTSSFTVGQACGLDQESIAGALGWAGDVQLCLRVPDFQCSVDLLTLPVSSDGTREVVDGWDGVSRGGSVWHS
jgi:hypothetical protein